MGVHSFQKLEGILALEKTKTIEDEPLSEGDRIEWFELPDGRLLLRKNPEGFLVERISSAYYHLEPDVTLEEK